MKNEKEYNNKRKEEQHFKRIDDKRRIGGKVKKNRRLQGQSNQSDEYYPAVKPSTTSS